ncbi:MAG TPA: UdgX family uracil-DNA binding protein [Ferrovibrio sp.]|jgi:uracil-DNA glycosylase family protein|uniref:UdgX family uracil-DNA binding protein n=1 Tax=Ferrovibrio sp. TaxID=1917215 RepID=UPI002B4ABDC7|nr:UdgX family uracil-DNA binding protein [Ferrovibrio sp.]HLT78408.1 UdgX family uracil-DNA binding protein [Ferrovibrio sp.]
MVAAGLAAIAQEIQGCRRCPLYRNATQGVGGEGSARARLMLVGEQPGDREDLAGRPFVGPAGRMLDDALAEAGIPRKVVYITNAVKHFKNEPRGKRRLHRRPNAAEVQACRWWLERELEIVKPKAIIALGATAAQSLLQKTVRIGQARGRSIPFGRSAALFVTIHPSYLLRIRDRADRDREYDAFVRELRQAAGQ